LEIIFILKIYFSETVGERSIILYFKKRNAVTRFA
jgi:hypothetical protein